MNQEDLTIGIPLLIQDQNETVIYMDKFSDSHDLVEDEGNLLKKTDSLIKNEALIISGDSIKESVVNSDLMDNETFIINDDGSEVMSVKSKTESKISKENLTESFHNNNNNDNNFKSVKESEIYVNGRMIELADGTTAFVENSKGGKNEVYTPIRLYNGSVIYVVSGTLLSNNLDGTNNSESEEKLDEIAPVVAEPKQEKSKGFQCSYKNCNKSYTSFHHLKVNQLCTACGV